MEHRLWNRRSRNDFVVLDYWITGGGTAVAFSPSSRLDDVDRFYLRTLLNTMPGFSFCG